MSVISLAVSLLVLSNSAYAETGQEEPEASQEEEEQIDYASQVRPLLSDRCYHCHGPDADNQESEFRADTKENLFADLGGYAAIVPGDLEASEVHLRLHSDDPDALMPPPDSNRSLSVEEKRIIDLWIKQGAPYEGHWSFEVPERPSVPTEALQEVDGNEGWDSSLVDRWSDNPIDAFIARHLIDSKLKPSPETDPATLLRRASLTLTGTLPARDLQDRFLADPSEQNYQQIIGDLLASMSYAERQSLRWLDAARYADTDGYQNDSERTNWPWRDWVIKAFHENMPFDQFTIEQLAGDMIPEANDSQRLASAFNRNHRQNAEGGALAEEFFVENVIDRVETTSTVWLGLTFGCSRCHDHKYDPLSQREFYQMFAYFNNIGERGFGRGIDANPTLRAVSPLVADDEKYRAAIDKAEKTLQQAKQSIDKRFQTWVTETEAKLAGDKSRWSATALKSFSLDGPGALKANEDGTYQYSGSKVKNVTYKLSLDAANESIAAIMVEALPDDAFAKPRQLASSVNGNFVLTDWKVLLNGGTVTITKVAATFEQEGYPASNAIDDNRKSGWAVFGSGVKAEPVTIMVRFAEPILLSETDTLEMKLFFGSGFENHSIGKFRVKHSEQPDADLSLADALDPKILSAIEKTADQRTADDTRNLRDHYQTLDPVIQEATAALSKAREAVPNATVMVMREREGAPTPAYRLERGQYDQPDKSDVLPRGIPAALLNDPQAKQPQNRLELARWLVSRDNPLTARVIVNRIWQDHFGVGLVKTAADFGLQGEMPSHPELLDWLAVEFMESGWDVHAMHRLIVSSQTYRQASRTDERRQELDPENRMLSRGPRYRADGFTIRDIAMQASGLLNDTAGGPPVKPYQPTGLWEVVAANKGTRYKPSQGNQLYRKSLYTYWKRAVNPPRQTIFDAGGREICNVRVRRTNTPLQALVLMNDPTFIENARQLAQRVLQDQELSDRQRLQEMYRLAIARPLSDRVLKILAENLAFFQKHFDEKTDAAVKLLGIGESSRDESLSVTEHAAYTATAHMMMNLDEFVTIE